MMPPNHLEQKISEKNAIFSNEDFDVLPNSLNNEVADAPPFDVQPSFQSQPSDLSAKNVSCDLNMPFTRLPEFAFLSDNQASKRSLLNFTLRENYPSLKFSNSFWVFNGVWQDASVEVFDIQNTEQNSYRRYEFENCLTQNARGKVYIEVNNFEKRYRERYSCGQSACLLCSSKDRNRRAIEWISDYKQIIDKYPGFPGFLSVIFTLPPKYESKPLHDKDLEKKFLDQIQNILRELFGLKTRDNLAMHICVHPTGSSDLNRDRWHVHVIVFPAIIKKDKKTGKKIFKYVFPFHVSRSHTEAKWSLDLLWLRSKWNETLSQCLNDKEPGAINPEISFIPFKKDNKDGENPYSRFWANITHRFKYDMRSFGDDIQKAKLLTDKEHKLIVVKVEEDGYSQWDLVGVNTLVERYKFLRKHNLIRARGWAQSKKLNIDLLGIVEPVLDEKPECVEIDARIKVIRRKVFNSDIGKVILVNDEIYKYICPKTKKEMEFHAKDVPKWKW